MGGGEVGKDRSEVKVRFFFFVSVGEGGNFGS